jgi:hypothetical protein
MEPQRIKMLLSWCFIILLVLFNVLWEVWQRFLTRNELIGGGVGLVAGGLYCLCLHERWDAARLCPRDVPFLLTLFQGCLALVITFVFLTAVLLIVITDRVSGAKVIALAGSAAVVTIGSYFIVALWQARPRT